MKYFNDMQKKYDKQERWGYVVHLFSNITKIDSNFNMF